MQGIQAVNNLGMRKNDSRIGLDLLTDKEENFVNFESCCTGTVTKLLTEVNAHFTMYNQTQVDQLPSGDDEHLSPHEIDFVESLLSVKGKKTIVRPTRQNSNEEVA